MKMVRIVACAVTPVLVFVLNASAAPPVTAFTYQGQLKDGGGPANGQYDLQFALFADSVNNVQVGVNVTLDNFQVNGGLFTTTLDFGPGIITGDALWLQVSVRPGASVGAFTTLSPRQALTPAPYAQALALPYNGFSGSSVALFNLSQFGNGQAMAVSTSGTNTALFSSISNSGNPNPAVAGTTNGSGNGVQGLNTGTGRGGFFRISNPANGANALDAQTNGTGDALFAANSGVVGPAARLQLTNPASNANTLEVSTNGAGKAISAVQKGATGIGVHGITTQDGTAVVGEAQGDGIGVWGEAKGAGAAVFARNSSSATGTALQVDQGTLKVTGAGVGTNTSVFIHRATLANIGSCATVDQKCVTTIDHPMTNGDPNAILIVTYNTTPPAVPFSDLNTSPIGISYESGKWKIFNVDHSDMPVDTCFNVMVIKK